jgi:hypothetical protein
MKKKIKVGDIVLCCIQNETFVATKEIVEEVNGGDPDWVLVCKKTDPKYGAMISRTQNFKPLK